MFLYVCDSFSIKIIFLKEKNVLYLLNYYVFLKDVPSIVDNIKIQNLKKKTFYINF